MTAKQKQELANKLKRLGYDAFEVLPGEDDIVMLHVEGHFICGALYSLSLSDKDLDALIAETLAAMGEQA